MASPRRSRLAPLPVAALAVLGFGAVAAPKAVGGPDAPSVRLETLVPGRTLAFLAFEDIGAWGKRWQQTALARLGADPDMRAFLAPIEEDVGKMLAPKEGQDESPVPPEVREIFQQVQGLSGQAAVALVDVPAGREGPPLVVGNLDFGTHLRDLVTFVQRMKDKDGEMPLHITERDGRPWWFFGNPDHPKLVGSTVGSSLLVSTSRAWVEQVVATSAAAVEGSLAGVPSFTTTRAASGDGTALHVFGNVPALKERFLADAPPDAKRMLAATGLDEVRGVSYAFTFHGDGFRESVVVDAPPSERGLLPFFRGAPISKRGLAMAPATAFLYNETAYPLRRILPMARELLGQLEPRMVEKLDGALADAKAATGVDLEKDLLPLLDDEMSYYLAMPETGGLYPELVVSFGLKDPEAFEKAAQKAVDGLLATVGKDERVQGRQRVLEWHGKRLYVVELSGVKRRDMVPFTPTWAVLDGRWVVTLVPHAMKELILRREQGGKGLMDQEDMAALLRGAPEKPTGLGYVDLQALLTLLYDTGVPVLQTIAKPNLMPAPVRLDWALLPPTRAVRPYLRSVATHLHTEGDAIVISCDSPVGFLLPLMAGAGAAAAFTASRHHAMEAAEVRVGREAGDARLEIADLQAQQLVAAVNAYRAARGRLPASLGVLTQETDAATAEPFLERVPRDPWGAEYTYTVLDAGKGEFEVRSSGPDRTPNTLDDVVHPTAIDEGK